MRITPISHELRHEGRHDGKISTDSIDKAARAPDENGVGTRHPAENDAESGPSPFARILHGLSREVDRGEALVQRAIGGSGGGGAGSKELGNIELLALQAGVYRYSEAVDLAAKLVDRAASGVKTVIQGQ